MAVRKKSRLAPLVLVVILVILLLLVRQCGSNRENTTETKPSQETKEPKGLNRNPSAINYSKHARCRMDCRHITESEVREVLAQGKINYAKSDIGNNPDCKKKYVVEGKTKNGQRVRIIFVPCATELTVVTVIDLGEEWACDCE